VVEEIGGVRYVVRIVEIGEAAGILDRGAAVECPIGGVPGRPLRIRSR
jgi:hypothetical protein